MFEAHQPFAWYFGHFHVNREFVIGETKFRCLAEMNVFDVPAILSGVAHERFDWKRQPRQPQS
jgi:hypothetical protein